MSHVYGKNNMIACLLPRFFGQKHPKTPVSSYLCKSPNHIGRALGVWSLRSLVSSAQGSKPTTLAQCPRRCKGCQTSCTAQERFRTDAKAEGSEVSLGGWAPDPDISPTQRMVEHHALICHQPLVLWGVHCVFGMQWMAGFLQYPTCRMFTTGSHHLHNAHSKCVYIVLLNMHGWATKKQKDSCTASPYVLEEARGVQTLDLTTPPHNEMHNKIEFHQSRQAD